MFGGDTLPTKCFLYYQELKTDKKLDDRGKGVQSLFYVSIMVDLLSPCAWKEHKSIWEPNNELNHTWRIIDAYPKKYGYFTFG